VTPTCTPALANTRHCPPPPRSEPALTLFSPRLAATLDYVWFTPGSLEGVGWLAMPWESKGNGVLMKDSEDGEPRLPRVGELTRAEQAMRTIAWIPHDMCESTRVFVCCWGGGWGRRCRTALGVGEAALRAWRFGARTNCCRVANLRIAIP
jgi:hypothetical protein